MTVAFTSTYLYGAVCKDVESEYGYEISSSFSDQPTVLVFLAINAASVDETVLCTVFVNKTLFT